MEKPCPTVTPQDSQDWAQFQTQNGQAGAGPVTLRHGGLRRTGGAGYGGRPGGVKCFRPPLTSSGVQDTLMLEELPLELAPTYTTAEINGDIVLYDGSMEITQGAKSWVGDGTVRFEWLPYSHVAVRFHAVDPHAHLELAASKLRIGQLGVEAEVTLRRVPFAFPRPSADPAVGVVHEIAWGTNVGCARLRFHLANLPLWIGNPVRIQDGGSAPKRISLRCAEWDVTIDAIKFDSREHEELRQSRGNGLTHVGVVTRQDGAQFTLTSCEPLLDCIAYFLSFCRGVWTRPILLSAEDDERGVIGGRWASSFVDQYKSTISWVPSTEPSSSQIQEAFHGYAKAWFGNLWGDALRIVTQWYVESMSGAAEKSIILMQAALEMCAWVRLVQQKNVLTKKDWKSKENPFSKKLRSLLSLNSIPHCIPPSLSSLMAYCSACSIGDGPEAMTRIRNALVHPSPAKRARLRAHPRAVTEMWTLASWYMDLCMLNACEYRGRYSNRTADVKWAGEEVELVPWH